MNDILYLLIHITTVQDLNKVKLLLKNYLKDGLAGLSVQEVSLIGKLVHFMHIKYYYTYQLPKESDELSRFVADLFLKFLNKKNVLEFRAVLCLFTFKVVRYINEKFKMDALAQIEWLMFMGENFMMANAINPNAKESILDYEGEEEKKNIQAVVSEDFIGKALELVKKDYKKALNVHLNNLNKMVYKIKDKLDLIDSKSLKLSEEFMLGLNVEKYSEEQLDEWMKELDEIPLEPLLKDNIKEKVKNNKPISNKKSSVDSFKIKENSQKTQVIKDNIKEEESTQIIQENSKGNKILDLNKQFDSDETIKKIKNTHKSGTAI